MAIYELSYVNNQQERVTKLFGVEGERTAYMERNFLEITHAILRQYPAVGGEVLEDGLGEPEGDYLRGRRLGGELNPYAASFKRLRVV